MNYCRGFPIELNNYAMSNIEEQIENRLTNEEANQVIIFMNDVKNCQESNEYSN